MWMISSGKPLPRTTKNKVDNQITMKKIHAERRTVVRCLLSVAMAVYLCVVVPMARSARSHQPIGMPLILLEDTLGVRFVTAADVNDILTTVYPELDTMQLGHVNTYRLLEALSANNRIENASVNILADGKLRIRVVPMVPVARVFPDDNTPSHYVNAVGKRLPADPQHCVDVPVLCGNFTDPASVRRLLPMLATIHADAGADALVASVSLDRGTGDIIVHPNVVGHVINMGDTSAVANKLARVRSFYHSVMPVKGWNYYDTVSVKWNGRVVATRRTKMLPQSVLNMYIDSLAADDARDYVDESVTMPPEIDNRNGKTHGANEPKDSSQTTSNKHQ